MSTEAPDLVALYTDLHAHPELGFAEVRTAAIVAEALREWGYAVTTGIGGTGVAAVLERGDGPTVLLRADMDGLPVREETGLPYASTATGERGGEQVPTMHACGHDVHVTCLLGAAHALAADDSWAGRLVLVAQPAEELGTGARAMLDDGLYGVTGTPDVVLGQHVAPLPTGVVGLHPGPAFATSDTLRITLHGRGGHGSRPEATVDPVVMAAAVVLRLQTIVAREVGGSDTAVVTVGTLHAGIAPNVIPDDATLQVNVRTYDEHVRTRVLSAIDRIARAEAEASGAPQPPTIEHLDSFAAVVNDPDGCSRTAAALRSGMPGIVVVDPGPVTGSEDVGELATDAGVPCVYWILGGADPAPFAGASGPEDMARVMGGLPSNHSPKFAPVPQPTLDLGVRTLVTAAREWLG
ncbi:amidohydrolase [Cellulomonas sp. HZM]|uniref:amidohydrolase n=1 Tax=Cellulomonas sp. HZM TaxID=1454010 RepID=UPI0004935EC1|nr:amidohydrolase [Cellulomonas sp. HZM]